MVRVPTHRPPAHPGEILVEDFLKVFNTTPDVWLNLQQAWDLYHAMHAPGAQAIADLRPLKTA